MRLLNMAFVIFVSLGPSLVEEEEVDRSETATLKLQLKPPAGMEGRHIGVIITRKEGDEVRKIFSDVTTTDSFTIKNISPGTYRLETSELTAWLHGLHASMDFAVPAEMKELQIDVPIKKVRMVEIDVQAVTDPGGEPINSSLSYWRKKGDEMGFGISGKRTIKIIEDKEYWFKVKRKKPHQEHGFLGPIKSGDIGKDGIVVKVPEELPSFKFRLSIDESGQKVLDENHRLYAICVKQQSDATATEPELAKTFTFTKLFAKDRVAEECKLYGLKDGSYALRAVIGLSNMPNYVKLKSKQPLLFKVEGGKGVPESGLLEVTAAPTGTIKIVVVDEKQNPVPDLNVEIGWRAIMGFCKGRTNEKGEYISPVLSLDTYKILVAENNDIIYHKQLEMQPGENVINVKKR